jgi:hypothetical protein
MKTAVQTIQYGNKRMLFQRAYFANRDPIFLRDAKAAEKVADNCIKIMVNELVGTKQQQLF